MADHALALSWLDFEVSYNVAKDNWINDIVGNGDRVNEDNLIYTALNTDTAGMLINHINTTLSGCRIVDGTQIFDILTISDIGVGEQLFELLCYLLLELTTDFMWKVEELELDTYSLTFRQLALDYNTLTLYIMCSI